MILLLLLGCNQGDLNPKVATLLDQWYETSDALPYMQAPSCGYLDSDGTVTLEDSTQTAEANWSGDGNTVDLTWSVFKVGTLIFNQVEGEIWNVSWDLTDGSSGDATIYPGCPFK